MVVHCKMQTAEPRGMTSRWSPSSHKPGTLLSVNSRELLTCEDGGEGRGSWGTSCESLTLHHPYMSALTLMAAIKNPRLER